MEIEDVCKARKITVGWTRWVSFSPLFDDYSGSWGKELQVRELSGT